MKDHKTRHDENLDRLARIEGQVRGLQRMVRDGEYCIDIITQIQAVRSALRSVSTRIMEKHISHCLTDAAQSRNQQEIDQKIEEIIKTVKRST
jgi:DNA-binding FrmR family transcriptional regulator